MIACLLQAHQKQLKICLDEFEKVWKALSNTEREALVTFDQKELYRQAVKRTLRDIEDAKGFHQPHSAAVDNMIAWGPSIDFVLPLSVPLLAICTAPAGGAQAQKSNNCPEPALASLQHSIRSTIRR